LTIVQPETVRGLAGSVSDPADRRISLNDFYTVRLSYFRVPAIAVFLDFYQEER